MKIFLKPRKVNIVDLVLVILIIIAFYYPKYNGSDAKRAINLADDAYLIARDNRANIDDLEYEIAEVEDKHNKLRSDFDFFEIMSY